MQWHWLKKYPEALAVLSWDKVPHRNQGDADTTMGKTWCDFSDTRFTLAQG